MKTLCVTCMLLATLPGMITLLSVKTPTELTVITGSDLEIPCQWNVPQGDGKSSDSDVILQWFIETDKGERRRVFYKKGRLQVREKPEGYAREMLVGEDFTMLLKNVTRQDSRGYICQVTAGAGGTEDSTARVTVRDVVPPETEFPDKSVVITQETYAEVGVCIARNGYPQPKITWHRGNESVVTSTDFIVQETVTEYAGDLYTVTSRMLYRQRSFTNATFHCQVHHGSPARPSTVASGRITAVHEAKPQFQRTLVQISIPDVKTDNILLCEATANPRPTISWNITGTPVEHWNRERNVLSSQLQLNVNDPERVTVVTCSAWNKHGRGEMTFVVQYRKDKFTRTIEVVVGVCVAGAMLVLLIISIFVIKRCQRNKEKPGEAEKSLNPLHKGSECC
ncbi:basal cell adhesion molecule-like [Lethenteron reissneri]|uniref:basal cell adhesion molecule-like n=1 Tax=Lethenteron reissneri TaxID=7753 RepID=UPI002AB736EF|nr:basal cell adhesion molecule-like [Lethenteron reissneri]